MKHRLTGNAKYCILFHPFWAIPYNLYYYFLSLYLLQLGITDSQLSTLVVVGAFSSAIFSLFASPIVDSLGRKKTTFIFDLLSSALPPLLYFLSGNFLVALIATLLTNTNKIMSVAYYLLMIEDSTQEETITAFNWFNIISIASSLLIPFAGVIVKKYGLIPVERFFLMSAFISMTTLIILRNRVVKETSIGKIKMNSSSGLKFQSILSSIKKSSLELANNSKAKSVIYINILFYIFLILATNASLYFVPYFSNVLLLNEFESSLLGGIYGAGMLITMMFINPRLFRNNLLQSSLVSMILTLIGCLIIILIPVNSIVLAGVAVLLMALGYGIMKPAVETLMAFYTSGDNQSSLYSYVNFVSAVISLIITSIGGILYQFNNKSIYLVSIVIVLIMITEIRNLINKENEGLSNEL